MKTYANGHDGVKDSFEEVKASMSKLWDSVVDETGASFEKMAKKTGKWFDEKKSKITGDDVDNVLNKAQDNIKNMLDSGKENIRMMGKQAKLLYEMLRDSVIRKEFDIPWSTVAAITATLLYLVSPIDFMPDIFPGFGLIDDALVIAMCVSLVRRDLRRYADYCELDLADYGLDKKPKAAKSKVKQDDASQDSQNSGQDFSAGV